jgi:hypothetical protein
VLHADFEVLHIEAHFALINQRLVFGEDEFDRVFEREDMDALTAIDEVEQLPNINRLTWGGQPWFAYPLWSSSGSQLAPLCQTVCATRSNLDTDWAKHMATIHPREEAQTPEASGVMPLFVV